MSMKIINVDRLTILEFAVRIAYFLLYFVLEYGFGRMTDKVYYSIENLYIREVRSSREMVPNMDLLYYVFIPPFLAPVFIYGVLYFSKRLNKPKILNDFKNFILGISLAILLSNISTHLLKVSFPRPRPDVRVDFNLNSEKINLLPKIPPKEIGDNLRSFPSAHSAYAFSIFFYIAIHAYKRLTLVTFPSIAIFYSAMVTQIATFIATSRVIDYRHHPSDVIVGSLVGIIYVFLSSTWYDNDVSVVLPQQEEQNELLKSPV